MATKSERTARLAPMGEALEILEERKKEAEIGYEQVLVYDHLKKFAKLSAKNAEKLAKEIEELGISKRSAVSAADNMPSDLMQLKQILANEKNTPEPETVDKAFALIQKYQSK